MDLLAQTRQMISRRETQCTGKSAVLYILQLSSGLLYVGSTNNLFQRMADHSEGIACKTTRDDRPEALVYVEPHSTYSAARKREAQIKRWSRAKKEALIRNDMETLRRLSKSRE